MMDAVAAPARTLTVHKRYDAPPAELYAAWTTPEILDAWWGPAGFTTTVHRLEARPGGGFHFEMTAPDGSAVHMTGTYTEADPGRRLAFAITKHERCDGAAADAADEVSRVTVTFATVGVGCEVTVVHEILSGFVGAEQVWHQKLDRLAAVL